MLFHTPAFFLFLAVVLPAFYFSPRRFRNAILLAASYYFYMCWNAKFVVLLWVLTAIDYTAAIWMTRVPPGARRRAWLIVSLAANLGFLGFFKYFNFLAADVAMLTGRPANAFALDIVLPMGISFHTFQSMSYVIDVYRGEQEPIRNVVDYALYIAFFPQLVAGPIVRARHFFADLYHWCAPSPKEQLRGILLVVFGLVKKVAIADQFAHVADAYFHDPASHPGGLAAWSGAAASIFQATRTWQSASRSCSDFTFRRISAGHTLREASPSSGAGGTSRFRAGCETTYIYRSAETAADVCGRIAI